MKAIKLAAIVFGSIVMLVLVTLAALHALLNSTRIKAAVADAVFEHTQRTLQIDGDLDLGFWQNLSVGIDKARLSESRGAQEFAAVDNARISVELLPLLSNRIVVDTIEIDGLRVALIKRKDGSLNIDDLIARPSGKEEAPTSPNSLEVAEVKIANAHLTWRDEGGSNSIIGADIDLATGRVVGDTGGGGYSIEAPRLAATIKSGDNTVTAKLALPQLTPAHEVTLEKIEGSVELASPKLQRPVRLTLAGRLHADLARSVLNGTLSSKLDESTIGLKFDVARFSPLDLGFALDVDRLDADRYLVPDKKTSDDDGIDLSALKGLNVHGTVHIGELQIANVKSRNIRLTLGEGG